jgi:UDP-N-acetylmuramoyl-tripeptide--D-alanyl-D-alanine ligase
MPQSRHPSRLRKAVRQARVWAARVYRSCALTRTTFIGVTGSCGKTTTKELIAAVLRSRFRGSKTPGNINSSHQIARYLFYARPSDQFWVAEVGYGDDSPFEEAIALVRPKICVVTNVGLDHYSSLRSRDAVAAVKGKLVEAVPQDGTAVLNADDPLVLDMRDRCRGRVVTYGLHDSAMVRAQDISGSWPDRLSLVVTCGGESVRVQTRLCGTHLAPNVVAALAVGHVMGISLADGAEAVSRVEPYEGRMSPVEAPDGITFIRDDRKAPAWAVGASLDFMKAARATRKVVVFGTISDYAGYFRQRATALTGRALQFADAVIGVGKHGTQYLRAQPRPDQMLRAFRDAPEALEFLQSFLEPGDLVLLKGSQADGLDYIVHNWRARNARAASPHLPRPAATAAPTASATADWRLIVGIGNPSPELAHTPHNVGHRALDALASHLGVAWTSDEGTMIADAIVEQRHLRLLKMAAPVNLTGPALQEIATRLGIPPERCLVVLDDMYLPLGAVRQRASGSAGGHKGLESILLAFQTQQIGRVKIGVGKPNDGDVKSFLLRRFNREQQTIVDAACAQSAQAVLEMIGRRT